MLNLFKKLKAPKASVQAPDDTANPAPRNTDTVLSDTSEQVQDADTAVKADIGSAESSVEIRADDGFTEWLRTRTYGGIERRERSDFFEEYNIYGADGDGRLVCRRMHRYPEHEKAFDMQYSRTLSFDEFNRRLLSDLDNSAITLAEYCECVKKAEASVHSEDNESGAEPDLTDNDIDILKDFCESADTLKDKSYINDNGVYQCLCESAAGGEQLSIRFRKPVKHDPIYREIPGVIRESIKGYDIENLWIMSVYNRLNEKCSSCEAYKLTAQWSLRGESAYVIICRSFPGIGGDILAAIGFPEDMSRFGFYSLDFSKR